MLLIGKHITSPGDQLNPVKPEKVFAAIRNHEGEVAVTLKRLRAIRMIDTNQYRKLKTALPYLVCGEFSPRIRKKENFVSIQRFVIDIDHISEFDLNKEQLVEKFKKDERIELLYTSPGGDGLKLFFVLKDKISDSGYYALFYKAFCIKFSEQYQLLGALDIKTNDVTRCCFVSHDPDAYYNPHAEPVDYQIYMPEEGAFHLDLLNAEIREKEKEIKEERKTRDIQADRQPLSDDILNQIKEKVGVRVKKPVPKSYIQPEELDRIIPEIIQELEGIDVHLQKMSPIDYGRQIRVNAGQYWAEVNIFFGRKGVSVVGTSKTGSNSQLCSSVVMLLKDHFNKA